jgi:hypothetical protein
VLAEILLDAYSHGTLRGPCPIIEQFQQFTRVWP